MTAIASIDYAARRFYLHADTVTAGFNAKTAYLEERALRYANADYRLFRPLMVFNGNDYIGIEDGLARYTPSRVDFGSGVRGVPYSASHRLLVSPTKITCTADGISGLDLFDRSGLSAGIEINIDIQVPQVEVIVVVTGSGVTPSDKLDIAAQCADAVFNTAGFPSV